MTFTGAICRLNKVTEDKNAKVLMSMARGQEISSDDDSDEYKSVIFDEQNEQIDDATQARNAQVRQSDLELQQKLLQDS